MSPFSLGRLRGVPLRVHWSFLLLPAFLMWWTGSAIGLAAAAAELGVLTAVFACVVLHELGHALAARRWGISTGSITLYPFGGVARLDRNPPSGRAEAAIAAAGPAVNLALAGVLVPLAPIAGLAAPAAETAILALFWINLGMAVFNLMPGFPLDGGRALRGLLSECIGEVRATVWAASIGQILAVVLVGVGLIHEPWLALAGAILLPAANRELRTALRQRAITSEGLASVMSSHPTRVAADARLEHLLEISRRDPSRDFLLEHATGLGWLPATRVWRAYGESVDLQASAGGIAVPLVVRLRDDTPLAEAAASLQAASADAAAVEDARGRVIGVVSADRLRVALRLRHALGPDRFLEPDEPE